LPSIAEPASPSGTVEFDTTSHREFVEYYERQSLTEATRQRFSSVRDRVLRILAETGRGAEPLDVLDIGCGAGTQCLLWAAGGDRVRGIDVNAPLIETARRRAEAEEIDVRFDVGSATALPYADASMDVCLMPELLEHVPAWEQCLAEAVRVLRPGGILYASTTNVLCPVQHEFTLPLYSWYPGPVKRRIEKLAVTTRPALANYARYPAVNWFSYYGLARHLRRTGMSCRDRFDLLDAEAATGVRRLLVAVLKRSCTARAAGQVLSPGTIVFAVKGG
jgi:2-polyprenyl-6-hydroxyphenyl methylase/3-demethylubiquinone-9 3-methyltransferase